MLMLIFRAYRDCKKQWVSQSPMFPFLVLQKHLVCLRTNTGNTRIDERSEGNEEKGGEIMVFLNVES